MAEPWFNPNSFGAWYGAIVGGGGGTLGGILGALAGTLAPRGKGKTFILGTMTAFMVLGLASLAVGLFALAKGQPYGIWYPLVLTGLVFGAIMACLLPVVRRRYREAEDRRLDAESIRQS